MRRWDDNPDLLPCGVGALVYGLLDVIVDTHFEVVTVMDDIVESLEDGLFDGRAVSRKTASRRRTSTRLPRPRPPVGHPEPPRPG